MQLPKVLSLSSSVFFCLCGTLSAAGTSNLTFPDTGWPGDSIFSTTYLSSSFTTNALAGTYTLENVIVNMGSAINPNGTFVLELRSGSSTQPGSVIAQLVGETNPSDGLFTYVPSTTIILNSNTTYWLVAKASGSGGYRWKAAINNNQSGEWSIGNSILSSSNGTNWTTQSYPPSLFSVTATPVPETSAPLLMGIAGVTCAFGRKRRLSNDVPRSPLG